MPANLPEHLQHLVDDVCSLGCQRVNEIIDESTRGIRSQELKELEQHEVRAVVDVLKQVMAVYDRQ